MDFNYNYGQNTNSLATTNVSFPFPDLPAEEPILPTNTITGSNTQATTQGVQGNVSSSAPCNTNC